jgi:hypothetical protein
MAKLWCCTVKLKLRKWEEAYEDVEKILNQTNVGKEIYSSSLNNVLITNLWIATNIIQIM